MDTAALTLALTAGALAALNPCGFALLPAYLSLSVLPPAGAQGGRSGGFRAVTRASSRAVLTTGVMTAGFVTVFVGFGLLVLPFAAASQRYLPYVTAATGGVLAVVGLLLLGGRTVTLPVPRARGVGGRGAAAMFGYGIVYALASLTCTIGPFLAIVVTSLRSDDVGRGVGLFVAYALGMGAVVGVAAMAVALAAGAVLGRMRRTGRWLPRLTGLLLLVVGAYVAYYGVWEVRVLDGSDPDDVVVDTALEIQRRLSDMVRAVLPEP